MLVFIYIYYTKLFIAPQWWLEPFIGIRVDLILYPAWLALISLGRAKYFYRFSASDRYLLYFVGWLLLSIIVNAKNVLSVQHATQYITWIIMYKLFQATIIDLETLKKVAKILVGIVLVLVVEGIQHKLSLDGLGWAGQDLGWVQKEVVAAGGTGRTRWVSIFDGPGVFCIAYTTALPFVMRYLIMPTSKIVKITAIVMTAAFLLAIYYTGSRGGFLATIAIVTLFIMYKSNLSLAKLSVISTLLVVLFALAPSHLTNVRDSSNSAQHRVDMWGKGAEMARYNPVFGVGRGNYLAHSHMLIAHNSFIELMAETGFPGVYLWMCILYLAFKNVFVYHKVAKTKDDRLFAAAVGISLAGYFVSSVFVTAEFETLYMLIAFAAILGTQSKEHIVLSLNEKIILFGALFLTFIFIKFFVAFYFG